MEVCAADARHGQYTDIAFEVDERARARKCSRWCDTDAHLHSHRKDFRNVTDLARHVRNGCPAARAQGQYVGTSKSNPGATLLEQVSNEQNGRCRKADSVTDADPDADCGGDGPDLQREPRRCSDCKVPHVSTRIR